MTDKKLAMVVDHGNDYFTVDIGGVVVDRFDGCDDNSTRRYAEYNANALRNDINKSSDSWAASLVAEAVKEEREACAKVAETCVDASEASYIHWIALYIAKRIRDRAKLKNETK